MKQALALVPSRKPAIDEIQAGIDEIETLANKITEQSKAKDSAKRAFECCPDQCQAQCADAEDDRQQ